MPASAEPREMVITSSVQNQQSKIQNVFVGEVWICSGQSNMAMTLGGCDNAQEVIAKSADPMLRLFTVPREPSDTPLGDIKSQAQTSASPVEPWPAAGPTTVPGFSAVGYFFGRDLRKALNVPVGIINSSVGGTPAEAWTSMETLKSDSAFKVGLDAYAQVVAKYPEAKKKYEEALAKFDQEAAKARAEKKPVDMRKRPRIPYGPESPQRPAGLYNGMIAPLQPYAIRGALWYQGEGNAGRAYQYRRLLPAMIKCWRKAWGQGDFTFLVVQLAPYMKINTEPEESGWAELREAQLLTSLKVRKCGLAVITDAGDPNNIHPTKKEPAGARLALAARAIAYGEKIVYSGPLYRSMKIEGNKAILSFKDIGGGLVAQGGELKGFTLCGPDKKFVNARAEIQGDTVVVSSPQVERPVAVRYGWANCPVVNLFNKEGLPASPFRTDNFPGLTMPKPAK
jgi:sialate O-acetylesterase